ATAFDDPATAAAWRTKPSWAVFGTADYPVAPELHRFAYRRAGSTVTEVEGASHFLMLSQPDIVAHVIREAVIASAVNVAAEDVGVASPCARCGGESPFDGVAKKGEEAWTPWWSSRSRFPPTHLTRRSSSTSAPNQSPRPSSRRRGTSSGSGDGGLSAT